MASTLWRGNIQISLINVPVRLVSLENAGYKPDLHLCHETDGGRVKQRYICEKCGKNVSWSEMARITKDGVVVTKEELRSITPESYKNVRIEHIFEKNSIPADMLLHVEKTYLITTDEKQDAKPYKLLWEVLKKRNLVAMGTICLKSNSPEKICLITANENGLFLQMLSYADEIRHDEIKKQRETLEEIEVSGREVELAEKLFEELSTDAFDFSVFAKMEDKRTKNLKELIASKKSGIKIEKKEEKKDNESEEEPLFEQLKRAVEEARKKKKIEIVAEP
ncbi:hypothetical protein DRH14_02445 [Candidatus Shapirobacteria bacterium]|nr:MAG: hypothetical protein DRH14_02445 [Candidatus Shapirobacteria bacterium]